MEKMKGARRATSWWLFWGSAGLILYTYGFFPLLLALRAVLRPRPVRKGNRTPAVSMIIAAYNEAAVIREKLDNVQALDYPRGKLEIIVASDGSNDGTNELVQGYPWAQVRLLALPRQGKNQTLNTAVQAATGEILVFSDADTMLHRDALRHLVAPFSDPSVGGVGGDFRYTTAREDGEEGSGERTYWEVDRWLKMLQSRGGSMSSATGQIYAVRRHLFRPVPGGVTDDFFISVQVPSAHQRLVFEPRAVGTGLVAASPEREFRRKVRVILRGLNSLWLNRHLLNPRVYGFYAVQLFSHKVLRRLLAIPLLVIGITAPLLWQHGRLYRLAAVGQVALHGAALLGFLLRHHPLGQKKPLSLPFFLYMVYSATMVAVVKLLQGERRDIWEPQRSSIGYVQDEVA